MAKKKYSPDESQKDFGQHLAEIRKNNHLTQEQIARQLQVNRSTYTYYETGKTQFTLSRFVKVAEAVGVPPLELFKVYLQYQEEK